MLHRSFKPAKCKTSLRLAMARIKLLKNKDAAHLKQLKREVAQLLESGQEQTARIRVEHVTREEKTMAAYDLLEIYCELIVARLPIIESQKNCPIDLKEAIASVVFASQRCADVTELADVRKHFTAKYGKEFISSALELLPDSGVNRTMVEKLSARAPDGETKIKILTTIAQEHNINWDPNSFGGNDPKIREDFMNQPSTLENVTKMHVQAPYEQIPINGGQKHEASVRPSESNAGSSPYSQTRTPDHSSHNITMSAMYHPEMRPSAFGTEGKEFGNTFSENKNDFHLNRQNWSMEFKDATSAAQAAAESAERASMAARAAAELSSRGKNASQYSTESRASSIYGVKYEGSGKSFSPVFDGEGEPVTRDSASKVHNSLNTSYDMNPRMQNQQKGRNDQENVPGVSGGKYNDRDSSKRSGVPASSEPSVTSIDNDISMSNLRMADGYSQKSSSVERTNFDWQAKKPDRVDFLGNLNVNKQFPESEAQFANQQHQMKKTENDDGSGEESIRKQSFRSASSHSHASHDDEDHAIANFNVRSGDDNVELSSNIFQGNRQEDTRQQLSHDYSPVFFDESGSDDDTNFDTPSRESSHFSEKVSTWSPGNNRSGFFEKSTAQPHFSTELPFPSEFAERPTISSSGDLLAATFDDSDGVSSESEEEMNKLKLNERKESSGPSYEQSVYSRNSAFTDSGIHELRGSTFVKRGSTGANRPQLHSFDDSVSEETLHDKRQDIDMDVRGESSKAYDLGELPTEQKYPRQTRSQGNSDQDNSRFSRLSMGHKVDTKEDVGTLRQSYGTEDNSESQNLSSSESGHELNFGKLRGGLRNRGYRHPPYTKDLSSEASHVSAQQSQAIPDIMSEPTNLLGVESSVTNQARNQESLNPKVHKKVHKESKTSAPKTFFDSDDDDPEDIHRRQPVVTKSQVGGTISRRTQGSSAKSEAATRSRPTVQSEEPASSYFGMGEKVSSKGSSETATEPLPKLRAQMVRSETRDRSESQGTSSFAEQPSSKPMPESNTSARRGTSKLPTADQPSVPPSKVASSGRTESPRKPILSGDSTSRENSMKKASHVHPKLPDYDTLASHFESLRSNRR